jgi:pyruvate dehydrogenase E2 component (dihydrolipoamide acetyltransferase)
MATELRLPLLGDVMTEGRIVAWLEAEGAEVQPGQPLYELETEKVSYTVEAPIAGTLRRVVPEGETVPVGAVVGRLLAGDEEDEAGPESLVPEEAAGAVEPPPAPPVPAVASSPVVAGPPVATTAIPLATPAARRAARELGVDLGALPATGRIREDDVRAFHAAGRPAPAAADGAVGYRGRRRTIGERMTQSLASTAQLTFSTEVGVDRALEMVDGLNEEWKADGVVVTLTRLVVKACARALGDHPRFNARLDGDEIALLPDVNVGIALDQEAGLIVPVVRNVDRLSLRELSRAARELTERGRADRLTPADLEGGTFTVTSLASTVVDAFTPIINPPQAAILGVGRVRETVGFDASGPVPRRVTTLSLTFDHRLNDGAPAARFLGRVVELVERPYVLVGE